MTTGRPIDDLENRFKFHPADENTGSTHAAVRAGCLLLARNLVQLVPPGRELSQAISRVEEAMMWANAGIARAPRLPEPDCNCGVTGGAHGAACPRFRG